MYQTWDYLPEKRYALDAWAAQVERIVDGQADEADKKVVNYRMSPTSGIPHRKRGRQKGTTKRDHPQYSNAHRPAGTKKRDPDCRDFEDMQFPEYVQRRIAQLTAQAGKPVALEIAIGDIAKQCGRGDAGLLKYYRLACAFWMNAKTSALRSREMCRTS